MNKNDEIFEQTTDNFAAGHNATQVTIQQLAYQNVKLKSLILAMQ